MKRPHFARSRFLTLPRHAGTSSSLMSSIRPICQTQFHDPSYGDRSRNSFLSSWYSSTSLAVKNLDKSRQPSDQPTGRPSMISFVWIPGTLSAHVDVGCSDKIPNASHP